MNAPLPNTPVASAALPNDLLADGGDPALRALRLDNSFARLDAAFHTRLPPTPLPDPYLVAVSDDAAALIGLDGRGFELPARLQVFAGNRPLPGGDPLAAVYSGHQFGQWAGQLGDGRAILLGEALGPDGRGWEIQLKGAGRTPYSRMGDGRAVLRSSIREFLCSEAMHALGIPTTRALSVIGSDQPVIRESVETAAVVARLSPSFVRFGHFEHFYSTGRFDALRALSDYVIDRFVPEAREAPNPHAALLRIAAERTARLIAQWQAVGFCHGVMNTDNMSILGLTIDYGPFGFLDGFDSNHICNHSDHGGRYAYAMQPGVGEWNCYALGQAMVPLMSSVEEAQQALSTYRPVFAQALSERLHAKLGLLQTSDADDALIDRLFRLLQGGRVDFSIFFRRLAGLGSADGAPDGGCRDLFVDMAAFDAWAADYRARLRQEGSHDEARAQRMRAVNPKYVLRNHLAENAIRAASEAGRDFGEVRRLLELLRRPYDEQPESEHYAAFPPDWATALSISCSS